MGKNPSLPAALKTLLQKPTFPARPSTLRPNVTLPAGRAAGALPAPEQSVLDGLFGRLEKDASGRGVGWGEWLSIATATLVTLNSTKSLQALHRHAVPTSLPIDERTQRALLMREVGLKCIGFIGIPKVINNLAGLRSAVEEDKELAEALPIEPRRKIDSALLPSVQKAAQALWDDIYHPHSAKLLKILGTSHPDLPVFIVDGEYGPLFSPPATFKTGETEPAWEVNRLRTSLVAMSALRAQGGVGPQVTSHVWGLLKAKESVDAQDRNREGLDWLTSEEGALWVVRTVDGICEAVEGADSPEPRESKL